MKKNFMPGCIVLAVATCALAIPNQVQAQGVQDHLHRLAVTIESKANLLLRETHHYRHTAGYHRLVSNVSKLVRTAEHVHDTTFCSRSFRHLEADMRILDQCFHQVEDFFDQVERDAAHGYGHVHGNTRHVRELLDCIEDTIHHMQDDVTDLRREIFGVRTQRPIYGTPVYRPPVYQPPIYDQPSRRPSFGRYDDSCPLDRSPNYRHRSSRPVYGGSSSFRIHF